jgi:hypothetical protein
MRAGLVPNHLRAEGCGVVLFAVGQLALRPPTDYLVRKVKRVGGCHPRIGCPL